MCDPTDVPSYVESPALHVWVMEAASRVRFAFFAMVDSILETKTQNERDREEEEQAAQV